MLHRPSPLGLRLSLIRQAVLLSLLLGLLTPSALGLRLSLIRQAGLLSLLLDLLSSLLL